ncbi:MAG: CDP-diacylglycerol--glycerol-3-phosphate 3-phosphatidyltransferase [Bacteroidota bacterium]
MIQLPISPPNQLTLLRILLTPFFIYYLFSSDPLDKKIALGIFIIAAVTDWYDGYVARRWGYVTRWGKFLDPLADKVLTSAAFISFVVIGYAEAWMVWTIVVRDFLITGLRSYAEYKNKPIDTSYFAKTKTFAQLIVIYLFLLRYIVFADAHLTASVGWLFDVVATPTIMFALMLVVTLMTTATGVFYFFTNWNILKELFTIESHGTNTERSTD